MDWKQAYYVGIHEIDEQHKALVEHVSDIERVLAKNEPWPAVGAAFSRLYAHAQNHFILEESLMRIHDFPRLHEHANEHWRFLAELRTFQELSLVELARGVDLLRECLDAHIQTWDKSYALHVLKRLALGGGSTSTTAMDS